MRARTVSLGVLLCLLCAGIVIAGVSADEPAAEMSVSGAIDTPTETITLEGDQYEVDEIAVIEPGDSIEVHVSSEEDYYLYLYNTEPQEETRSYMSSDENVVTLDEEDDDFDTNDLRPGTYMLTLEPDYHGREAVIPVVVQGHDIDMEYPTTAEQGSDIELRATVDPKAGQEQPDSLEVAIWNDGSVTDIPLTHDGGDAYSTTLSADRLDEGNYNVYASVFADETVEGYQTSLAVTAGPQLTVSSEEDTDDDSSKPSDDDVSEPSDDGTENATDDDEPETPPADDEFDDDDSQSVIDPNETEDSDETDMSDDDQLGSPILGSLLVSVIVTFVGIWRYAGRDATP